MIKREVTLRFPAFLGIGAQKAGTTWLHRMLSQHPDLWLPPLKEVHYFDRAHSKTHSSENGPSNLTLARSEAVARAKYWVAGSKLTPEIIEDRIKCLDVIDESLLTDAWYASIFEFAPHGAICGEITPEYALVPGRGIGHILRLEPYTKFLFIMRDPIDRCWSALRMEERKQPLGKAERLKRITRPGFLAYSDYMKTIRRYRKYVPPQQLLFLFYDQIIHQPEEVLREVCKFLGVEYMTVKFKGISDKVHAGPQVSLDAELYDALREALEPVYRRLREFEVPETDKWWHRHYVPA